MAQAESYWNDAVNTRIGPGPQSNNIVFHLNYPNENYLGLYSPSSTIGGVTTSFNIRLNEGRIRSHQQSRYPNSTYFTVAINVAVHELGHALYLADHPAEDGYGDRTIMSYSRDRTNSVPRAKDIIDIQNFRAGNTGFSETEYSSEVHADWPDYEIGELSSEADLIVIADVVEIEQRLVTSDIDGLELNRQFSTLEIEHTIRGESNQTITLNQVTDFVEKGKKYLLFLTKGSQGDYFQLSDAAVIQEVGG